MTWRLPLGLGLGLACLSSILSGCDYAPARPPIAQSGMIDGPLPSASGRPTSGATEVSPAAELPAELDSETIKRKEIILANFIKLIQTASTNPGGQNFAIATENLNEFFATGTKPSDYEYSPKTLDYLAKKVNLLSGQDPEPILKDFMSSKFSLRDARHIEDCMLYRAVANRVAGEGDDLTRVRRIFEWTVRNVNLIPPESLAGEKFRQAQARPTDVLFRGMATETNGHWSERGWLFMALCRQIGVDVGLLTYTPRPSAMLSAAAAAKLTPLSWVCVAAVEGKAYLFDQRLGMEIPGPDGSGVATLEQAMTDPNIIGRLDLPGQSPYGTTMGDLVGSPTKIGVLIDSSQGYLVPRMRLLQGQLRGENRTILYRDPYEQAKNLADSMNIGDKRGLINLWEVPIYVEQALFSNPDFVSATQMSLQFFDGKLPLLYARTAHLRGEISEAIDKYVTLRKASNPLMNDRAKTPIPPEVQAALDVYSTYFLAQCDLDQGRPSAAEKKFKQLLDMTPDPGPGRYFYYMLRWGALSNLGRLCEARGDHAGAVAYYAKNIQTQERHGNALKARDLVWAHPFDEPAPPLPPAPPAPEVKVPPK